MAENNHRRPNFRTYRGAREDPPSRIPSGLELRSHSQGEMERFSYRESEFEQLWALGVLNDNGSPITFVTDQELALIRAEIEAIHAILQRPSEPAPIPQRVVPFFTGFVDVPGVGKAVAYAANDAFGTEGIFDNMPESGVIMTLLFRDMDDEGIAKTLFLFSSTIAETTDNDAIALADAAVVAHWNDYISLPAANFLDAGGFRMGKASGLNMDFAAPERKLFWQFRTEGADNIAAGADPQVALMGYSYA